MPDEKKAPPKGINIKSPVYLGREVTPKDITFTPEEQEAITYFRTPAETRDLSREANYMNVLFPETGDGRQVTLKNIWALKHGTEGLYDIVSQRNLEKYSNPQAQILVKAGQKKDVYHDQPGKFYNTIDITAPRFTPSAFISSHELGHWRDTIRDQPEDVQERRDIRLGDLEALKEQGISQEEINIAKRSIQGWLSDTLPELKKRLRVKRLGEADINSPSFYDELRDATSLTDKKMVNSMGDLLLTYEDIIQGRADQGKQDDFNRLLNTMAGYGLLQRETTADLLGHTQREGMKSGVALGANPTEEEIDTYLQTLVKSPNFQENLFYRTGMMRDLLKHSKSYRGRIDNLLKDYVEGRAKQNQLLPGTQINPYYA